MNISAAVFIIALFAPLPAHAYVDPGSGSLLLQALAAVGVGLLFYISRIRNFIRGLFRRSKKQEAPEAMTSKPDRD